MLRCIRGVRLLPSGAAPGEAAADPVEGRTDGIHRWRPLLLEGSTAAPISIRRPTPQSMLQLPDRAPGDFRERSVVLFAGAQAR
jgi:hypothetical protein